MRHFGNPRAAGGFGTCGIDFRSFFLLFRPVQVRRIFLWKRSESFHLRLRGSGVLGWE